MNNNTINNCPFCKPLVNLACFAESANFRAIYNIAPILPGHCLIIPKEHLSSFLDVPDEVITEMMLFSRKVIKVIELAFGSNAFNWTVQDGKSAGQTIKHFHLHIIPRKENDLAEPGDWYPKLEQNNARMIDSFRREEYSGKEMKLIVEKLKSLYK